MGLDFIHQWRDSHTAMPSRSKPVRITTDRALLHSTVGDLQRERARLEEEVLQLKAAVNIWSEVLRHTMGGSKPESSIGAERS